MKLELLGNQFTLVSGSYYSPPFYLDQVDSLTTVGVWSPGDPKFSIMHIPNAND